MIFKNTKNVGKFLELNNFGIHASHSESRVTLFNGRTHTIQSVHKNRPICKFPPKPKQMTAT